MWWLSFCDPHRPEGTRFLGAVIAPGTDLLAAYYWCLMHSLNPGGEIEGTEFDDDTPVPAEFRGVLLSRERVEELDRIMTPTG